MAMRVDAHAHVDHYGPEPLDRALQEIDRLRIVTLAVSMDLASYEAAQRIAVRSPLILPAFGIHPWNAPAWADRLDELDELIRPKGMLGEVGLDYRFVTEESSHAAQRAVFERFVRAAAARGATLNLHTAGAEADVLGFLERYDLRRSIVHWYAGPLELLEGFVELDTYFTVGVDVCSSPQIQALARAIPDDRLLTETDNPDGLAWLTGVEGMPAVLPEVTRVLAELRGVDVAALERQVWGNLLRLLGRQPLLDRALLRAAQARGEGDTRTGPTEPPSVQ